MWPHKPCAADTCKILLRYLCWGDFSWYFVHPPTFSNMLKGCSSGRRALLRGGGYHLFISCLSFLSSLYLSRQTANPKQKQKKTEDSSDVFFFLQALSSATVQLTILLLPSIPLSLFFLLISILLSLATFTQFLTSPRRPRRSCLGSVPRLPPTPTKPCFIPRSLSRPRMGDPSAPNTRLTNHRHRTVFPRMTSRNQADREPSWSSGIFPGTWPPAKRLA